MSDVKLENFVHDLVYDFLVLMDDPSIYGDTDYHKGYLDSLYETYKILQDKIELFNLNTLPVADIMPAAELWNREGRTTVNTLKKP